MAGFRWEIYRGTLMEGVIGAKMAGLGDFQPVSTFVINFTCRDNFAL